MSECKCNVPCWRWDATLCSGCGRTLPDESTALRSQLAARDAELATVRATIEGLRKGLEHYARHLGFARSERPSRRRRSRRPRLAAGR